jgi:hypothetical protein
MGKTPFKGNPSSKLSAGRLVRGGRDFGPRLGQFTGVLSFGPLAVGVNPKARPASWPGRS